MRQGSPSTRLLCCYHKFYSIFLVKISLVFTSSFLCHEWTSPAGSLKWLLGRSLTSLDQGNEWHRHPLCLRLATGMWKLQITQSSQCSRKRSQWGQHLWCRERGDYELRWKTVLIPNCVRAQIPGAWTRNISLSASHTAPFSVTHLYELEFLLHWKYSYLGPIMDWTEIHSMVN